MKKSKLHILLALLCLCACSKISGMYPDYRGVTVPVNIAPLNFHYDAVTLVPTTFCAGDYSVSFFGNRIVWNSSKWKKLLAKAVGDSVKVSGPLGDWSFYVSDDTIDKYLTYRLIEPGYEVWDRVCICERDIESFEERIISDWNNTENSCMNCHIHKGKNSMFYLRGEKGGAIFSDGSNVRKLSLKTVYGDIHPNGRWGIFSTNRILPGFHTLGSNRLEVFDTESDLATVDFTGNRILVSPEFSGPSNLETFPCFSADGNSIFYCTAPAAKLPQEIKELHYSIACAPFDSVSGSLGKPNIIWDASGAGGSACHPKASPDGRWLLFTIAGYGTFPIWHRECDLALMNLQTGELADMGVVNSDVSDTYHSWSSNSRWFVFASKREDGQYGKPFICHIDEEGKCSKPFLLPQKDPCLYEKTLKSFNIPDLGIEAAPYDATFIGNLRDSVSAETFQIIGF